MAYSQTAAPIPPPPIRPSGNRNTMHVVGGGTANMGYQSGANLANARTLYQQGRTGSFFQNKAEIKPEFNYKPQVTQGDAPPTAGQAAGNQIRANTGGQIRPANAPAGLGYAHYGMNPTRQHTLKGAGGIEGSGAHLSYVAPTLAAPPPPPPPPTPQVVSPQPPSVSPTPAGPKPGPNMVIDPKTGQEAAPVGWDDPQPRTKEETRRAYAGKWEKGKYIRGSDGTNRIVVGSVKQNGIFKPLVNKPGGGTMVHPDWQGKW